MRSTLIVLCIVTLSRLGAQPSYPYVSPKPGSVSVSRQTNIIVRSAGYLSQAAFREIGLNATGSISGTMTGDLVLARDDRTLVFNPARVFSPGEVVTVTVSTPRPGGTDPSPLSFSFTIMPEADPSRLRMSQESDDGVRPWPQVEPEAQTAATGAAYLPRPPITIDSVNNPSEGSIFLAAWDRNVPRRYGNYFFILDRFGHITDSIRVEGAPFDFKVQPNGRLSYGIGDFSTPTPENNHVRYYVMDTTLAVIDSFLMKNGYVTDFHEFLILPNGHALMMSYHTIIYDMSTVVPGGRADASLVINVLQEQDVDKNVVFEWRNIDHIPITDSDLNLTDSRINYSTLNAFDVDTDGNILASFRNHSEIMKISRETGDVLWRWGSTRGSFSFIGEHPENAPNYFSRQHHVQRLANGHITLFDNGEFHSPWYSRAAEYELDEVNHTARLVDEYRYPRGDIKPAAAGNAQKLPGGGWFVGYGILHPMSPVKRNIVEVHADGTIALEISLPANVSAYRVGKYRWNEEVRSPSVSKFEVLQGNTYAFNAPGDTTGVSLTFTQLSGEAYNVATITRLPYGPVSPEFIGSAPLVAPVSVLYEGASILSQVTQMRITCSAFPEIYDQQRSSVYFRSIPGSGLFQKLETVYDSAHNELQAQISAFGEYIVGVPDVDAVTLPPRLVRPEDGSKIHKDHPIDFLWSGTGRGTQYRLQLHADSAYGLLIVDSLLTGSTFTFVPPGIDRIYVWRVGAAITGGDQAWSAVRSFQTTGSFLVLLEPDTGGVVHPGVKHTIRWNTNLAEAVAIQLLKENIIYQQIAVVSASYSAYTWEVPSTTPIDFTYRVCIVSTLDPTLADTSMKAFAVVPVTSVTGEDVRQPTGWALAQCFPNPFNPETKIEYSVKEAGLVKLSVYDMLGREVAQLVDSEKPAGIFTATWNATSMPSGVYFVELTAGKFTQTRKMILAR